MKFFKSQQGFLVPPIILVFLAIIGIVIAGYFYKNYSTPQPSAPSQLQIPQTHPSSQPTQTPAPRVIEYSKESSFQQQYTEYCKKGNPSGSVIDPKDLPVSIDKSVISIKKAEVTCWSGSVYIEASSDDYGINIYDKYSQEPGHGGEPWLGIEGKEIIKKGDIKITYYLSAGEGPFYVGGTTIEGRGEKEIQLSNGQKIYINTGKTLIKEDDPRLISILKKHAEAVQDPSEDAYIKEGEEGKVEEDIFNIFFKDLSKLKNPEKENLTSIEQILQAISSK